MSEIIAPPSWGRGWGEAKGKMNQVEDRLFYYNERRPN